MDHPIDNRTFGQAVADVLGLPSDKMILGCKLEEQDGFVVLRASFAIDPEDVAKIGQRIKELQGENLKNFTLP